MKISNKENIYFPREIQVTGEMWRRLDLDSAPSGGAPARFYRIVAERMNRLSGRDAMAIPYSMPLLFARMSRVFRYLLNRYLDEQHPALEDLVLSNGGLALASGALGSAIRHFVELYPPADLLARRVANAREFLAGDGRRRARRRTAAREMLLLLLNGENRALFPLRHLFDDKELSSVSPYRQVTRALDAELKKAPHCDPFDLPILELLRAPMRACPDSLSGQLEFIRKNWTAILPPEMLEEILSVLDMVKEEMRPRFDGPGPPVVMEFRKEAGEGDAAYGADYPEPEKFSPDTEWMPNVVLMAKMVYVWLDQLSRKYGRTLSRLDEIPDAELDRLAAWGFTGLWLIGLWERSSASAKIKHYSGNAEAISSAYSLYDYCIAVDLGGEDALENLRRRAARRGIRLASDMVPNHTGIDSRWTREHPDWFIQLDYPPFPAYNFTGPDLSSSPDISLRIEDGYWSKTDAAVVFQHVDNRDGRTRYIYHGNDGTSTPWNDTAQLNYLVPEVREAVIRTILHVARNFPIIRFDAAMTLAKKHYQRLWFPQKGLGGGIPSRAEHALSRKRFDELFPVEFWREVVDRVAAEAPDTLLLAEAFWLMEGYFVRTLGMHRVYNSAFMNMLKMEENAKYRQTIKNVLEFTPEILQRFVNFMNNPDERTAIDQFGREGKYFGATVLLVTMPGLPMFGHGQIEGFTEKYGMEYRRAFRAEEPDAHLVEMHERKIFPLMKRRRMFSGAANFVLYDFFAGDRVDENVFAYSNSHGDERALIVYHNRFASTSGWIRTSCARTVKSESGETRQVRTTLGEALAARPDGRYYYRFRDSATGLEYLRHGRDLLERGLYVELEAYEYHAFLDFREIRDDDYGTWGKVCAALAGRPVESLDEEFRQVRHAAGIAALARLASDLPQILPVLFDPSSATVARAEAVDTLRKRLLDFFGAVRKEMGLAGDERKVSGLLVSNLEVLVRTAGLQSRRAGAQPALEMLRSGLQPERGFNLLVLSLYLILRNSACLSGDAAPADQPIRIFTEMGFGRALAASFHTASQTDDSFRPPWDGESSVSLLKALLTLGGFFMNRAVEPDRLLDSPDARRFILLHESGGIKWFNKERFEALSEMLFLATVLTDVRGKGAAARIADVMMYGRATRRLIDNAARAGYRTDVFRQLSAGG